MTKMSISQALDLAKVSLENGEHAKARGLYQSILSAFPENVKALEGLSSLKVSKQFNLAKNPPLEKINILQALFDQKHYTETIKQATALLAEYPNSFALWNITGTAYYHLNKPKKALEAFKHASRIEPSNVDTYVNIGNTLKDLQKPVEALEAYRNAISLRPNFAELYNNLGLALQDSMNNHEALEAFEKAISIKPEFTEAHYNLGNLLRTLGKIDDAIVNYQTAIALNPNYTDAIHNLGMLLEIKGDYRKAIQLYNKVISLNPINAQFWFRLASSYSKYGKFKSATRAYKKAISIKPNYYQAHNNLGNLLFKQGKISMAINAYNSAILINPDFEQAYSNLGISLKNVVFTSTHPKISKTLTTILDKKMFVRPVDISKAIISLLKFDPNIKDFLDQSSNFWKSPLHIQLEKLSSIELFLKLMEACPINDLQIEKALKKIRFLILYALPNHKFSNKVKALQEALALQCHTNEYIYGETEQELSKIVVLENHVKKNLSKNSQNLIHEILCLASYRSLNEYCWHDEVLKKYDFLKVVQRQIIEPQIEDELKNEIPKIGTVKNSVSVAVQSQYEENPYPRWVYPGLPLEASTIFNVVTHAKLRIEDSSILNVKNPKILVAGCGTGQHAIETAARFSNASVVAVDLSLSSLAYAKRKAVEIGIHNIEFQQADILELKSLNIEFDIIESVGVLHHMENPFEGWKALIELLKVGGLIKIGLYSKGARGFHQRVRDEIKVKQIKANKNDMIAFRTEIINSASIDHKLISSRNDFFSLSAFRDLLFNVEEHCFSIPQIQDYLCKLNLKFCGFEPLAIVDKFEKQFLHKADIHDLEIWENFERLKPNLFAGMYQFWCQRRM